MADLGTQVEGLTGISISSPSTAEVSQYLRDGVIDVINKIMEVKPQDIFEFSRLSTTYVSNDFASIRSLGKVISVVRESGTSNDWRECRLIAPQFVSRVTDTLSIHYASKYNPAYTVLGDKVNVYPTPLPPVGADTGNTFKVQYVNIDPVALNGDELDTTDENIGYFPKERVYLVVIYAAIKQIENYLYDKNLSLPSDLEAPVLETVTSTLPTFVEPTAIVLPVSPPGANIDFSDVGSISSFVAPIFVEPSLGSMSDMSLPTVPTTPVLSDSSIVFTTAAPTYTAPVVSPDFSDANTWITDEEDSEMSGARMQVIGGQIQEFQSKVASAVNEFNKENAEYQGELQKSIQNAQIGPGQKVQKYSIEVQSYQQEVNKEVQRWMNEVYNKTFNEWSQQFQGRLTQYGSDIQKETARIGATIQEFQAQVNKAVQTYQAETGYDVAKYSSEIQASIARYQNDLAQRSGEFDKALAAYASEVQKVSAANQNITGKFGAEIQNYTTKINKLKVDYDWLLGKAMKLQKQYDEAFLLPLQKRQQQAAQPQRQQRRR